MITFVWPGVKLRELHHQDIKSSTGTSDLVGSVRIIFDIMPITKELLLRQIFQGITDLEVHEAQECFYFNRDRIYDPHAIK